MIGIEHIPELVESSIENLSTSYSSALASSDIQVICGDGRLGYPAFAPYNAIHVGAAAEVIP